MTKRKRRVTIIVAAIAAVILLIGSSLIFVIYRHEEISETLISTFHLKKGIDHWSRTHSSEEAKNKGVFVCYYDALPFEYKDSIFYMKLVFNEVYVEWKHWYKWPDSLQENCLYYKNSETIKDQQLIGVYDPSQCVLGISHILKPMHERQNCDDAYIDFDDTLQYLQDFSTVIASNKNCIPLCYWEIMGGYWPELFLDRKEYEKMVLTDDKNSAIHKSFPDTIRIPVYSSFEYNHRLGYEDKRKISFGELVLVKK